MAAGYDVKLANTVAIKVYDGLKYSGDEALSDPWAPL